MRLEQLEYLIEIVNCKSINKAAKNLFVSQPTLSLSIAKMEEEIGAKLLRRTKKGVVATNMGYKIYCDAIKVIQSTEAYLNKWQDEIAWSQKLAAQVNVLCMPSASALISNYVIQDLQECSPQIHLKVYEDKVVDDFSLLNNTNMRLVIGSCQITENGDCFQSIPDSWLVEPLFEDRLSVLISPKNPLSKKAALTSADCEKLTLAFYCYENKEYDPLYVPFFKKEAHIRLNSREAIMQVIAENNAVAIFPQKITQHDFYQKNNLIVSVLFDESIDLPDVMHYVAYRNDLTDAERKVVDTIHYCAQAYYS